jgi:Butirosin biosynthesis protein H, N-terminal
MNLPYTGNSAYCYANSLHMCLNHAGMKDLPNAGSLECFTGMPFGAMFLGVKPEPMFFPSPASLDPDKGLDVALETLGWTCDVWRGDNADEALEQLQNALRYGPVLLGPLDMGHLTYDPNHQHKRGGDHFVVVLAIEDGFAHLHDPQNYPFATLPTVDLIRAWAANHLGYATATYTLRYGFGEQRKLKFEDILFNALETAKRSMLETSNTDVVKGGSHAFIAAASLLRQGPSEAFKNSLVHFALPLGARRCSDASSFLGEAGAVKASQLTIQKARSYGQAQYQATRGQWERVASVFDTLADIEENLKASLS